MKHYKDKHGKVFAFEDDGSQDHLINESMVKMTDAEYASHIKPRERSYADKRRAELSPLDGEGMDAIRKEIAAIRAGEPETDDYRAYREKVLEIKNKHPK